MELWTKFLELLSVDPWWFFGTGILFVLVLSLFLFSFFRNIRQMAWFYIAIVLIAFFYQGFLSTLPGFLETIASYRADWSLVFLSQNMDFMALLTQLLLFLLLYGSLAVGILALLMLWSLVTFRWSRLTILLRRSITEPWFVAFFALISVVMNSLAVLLMGSADQETLLTFFLLSSFLFSFQFFIRLLDHAQLHTPALLMEFAFSIACAIFAVRFVFDFQHFLNGFTSIHGFFFHQLFSFFLMILLVGYFSSFLLKAVFASPFFLDQFFRIFPMNIGPKTADGYNRFQVTAGLVVSLAIGFLFLLFLFLDLILPVILLFFSGFFGLFYLLDRLEDLRGRGELVEKRLHSGSHRTFLK